MTDIFGNALSIAGSFMDSDLVNRFMMVIFAVILVFGVLNCILGYRLLRFWMMLGGFLVGGGLALVVVHTMGIQEKSTMLIAALAAGVVFAVGAFRVPHGRNYPQWTCRVQQSSAGDSGPSRVAGCNASRCGCRSTVCGKG